MRPTRGGALGGAYLRVVWDEDVSDRPWLSAVAADSAVPEFSPRHLRAVTFWTVVHVDGQTVWRHLERHEKGRILHGLYVGTPGMLGKRRPLQDLPATEEPRLTSCRRTGSIRGRHST